MSSEVADLSMPAVEQEITSLAGHLAAATCRFLQLLSAFDAGGGWHGAGMRSCAQWLSWRCGLSTGAAREQLRVARALDELPRTREAFGDGRISYSKARALTRVATADTEADLLETATSATASQLDRLCAGIARVRTSAEVLEQAARASFTARWEADGSLRFSGRLSAEDGALLLAALAAVRPDPVVDPAPEEACTDPSNAPSGAVAPALHDPVLDDPATRAARSDASALVLLAEHALSVPPPEVGSNPVRLVIHTSAEALASPGHPTAPAPAEALDPTTAPTPAEAPIAGVLDAGPSIPLLPLGLPTLGRLACEAVVEDAAAWERGRDRTTRNRFADSRQRKALLRRDGGCVFPGCPRRRALHAHHVRPWHLGGPTSLDNLALVCEYHHHLVHEGGWQLHHRGGRWHAVSPAGRVLAPAPRTSGDGGHVETAFLLDAPAGVGGASAGDPLDLDYAVAVFSQPRPAARSIRTSSPG